MPDGDKIVTVPGVGNVQFPGTMDDASINAAIGQHLQGIQNTSNVQRNATETPFEARNKRSPTSSVLKEGTLGALSGLGIAETTSPITDTAKGLGDQAKTIGKFWTGKPDDIKASLTANPIVSVPVRW